MRRLLGTAVAAGALVGVGFGTATLPAQATTPNASAVQTPLPYLVVLRQAPTASYQGGLTGYAATVPAPGQRFDDSRASVASYRAHLRETQQRLLATVGNPSVLYSYTTALDGFAAMLTPSQAKRLGSSHEVLLVQTDARLTVDDVDSTPGSLPVSERPPTRLWSQVGGARQAGRGTVIGVIDTGVSPNNPSLAGLPVTSSSLDRRYPGFSGSCERGQRWTTSTCSSKVVAARYFVRGFGPANIATSEYLSPRDGSGHGTSVASIAAGNAGIDTEIGGQSFGHISGMAPAAGLSVYKACWSAPDPSRDGCDTADVLAAIDQAVRDGVDVINYSIGGRADGIDDAVEMAFYNAAAANVFVATSAGNGGPQWGSVEHASPWVTTVGANTGDVFEGGVRLGDGRTLVGAMLSDRNVGPAPLVYARDAAAAGVSPARAALCYAGSLEAQRVDGAIVVCDRGVTSRVSKSAAVAQSGASAMVLVNTRREGVDADLHAVPTVHLDEAAGRAVKAYIVSAGGSASGSLVARATDHPAAPVAAGFSGRGPTSVADGDLLKPDLTAPGVSVVAAMASPTSPGRRWDVQSGTSIATPHVAGVAAVVMAAHPTWTPSRVKSALMTTATPLQGSNNPLVRGAGELDSGSVLDPGLVFDTAVPAWRKLLVGGAPVGFVASQINQPSIAVGRLVGQQTVRRTITNVGSARATYTASVEGLRGLGVSVAPSTLTLAPGGSASFAITFTATRRATYDRFATGTLTWRDDAGHAVASPVAVRPELASVPAEVTGSGRRGSVGVSALAGVTGTIGVGTSGLVGATPVALSLHPSDFDPTKPSTSRGTATETLSVPVGSQGARFQVTSADRRDDVDLYVYRGDNLVASATDLAADETLTLTDPQPGKYVVYVNAARAAGETADVVLTTWVLPRVDSHTLALARRSIGVNGSEPFSVAANWAGLNVKQRWWGYLTYRGLPAVTYLTIN